MFKLLRTTVFGGVVFLIPVVLLLVVVGRAVAWIRLVSDPLVERLPDSFVGHTLAAYLAAIVLLLLLCLVAGLVSRTRGAARLLEVLEGRVLSQVPLYLVFRSKLQAILNTGEVEGLQPVMVRFDDLSQMAFEIERLDDGRVAVFLPGAPDPWSGSVALVDRERVEVLDIPVGMVARTAYRLGRGTNAALASVPDR